MKGDRGKITSKTKRKNDYRFGRINKKIRKKKMGSTILKSIFLLSAIVASYLIYFGIIRYTHEDGHSILWESKPIYSDDVGLMLALRRFGRK